MTKFLSFGELWLDVDETTGVPGTVVRPGDDVPASVSTESIDWMATHGYTFDPMPDVAVAQAEAAQAEVERVQTLQQSSVAPPAPAEPATEA